MALPPDVTAALRKQAPKLMRKGMEREVKKKFNTIKQEMIKELISPKRRHTACGVVQTIKF